LVGSHVEVWYAFTAMTPEEQTRLKQLVQQIQVEKDHKRFGELVDQLNALLAVTDKELKPPS